MPRGSAKRMMWIYSRLITGTTPISKFTCWAASTLSVATAPCSPS